MASHQQVALAALVLCVLACCASAQGTCPSVRGVFYKNLDANYWASPPGQALCRKVVSSVYYSQVPSSYTSYLSFCGAANPCDCAALPPTSTPLQQAVQQLNAWMLDVWASSAGLPARFLPLAVDVYYFANIPGCLSSRTYLSIPLSHAANVHAEHCTTADSCMDSGKCAAAITSALQCTKDCMTEIGCEVTGYLRGTITPYSPTTSTSSNTDGNAASTVTTGWVSRTVNYLGEFYLTTSDTTPELERLVVTVPTAAAGDLFNMNVHRGQPYNKVEDYLTFGGAVGGRSEIDQGDIIPSSSRRSYAFLAAVEDRGPSTAQPGTTSAGYTQNNEYRIESSIWTMNPNSYHLTAHWINSASPNTPITPTLFQGQEDNKAGGTVGYLTLNGNLTAFCADDLAQDCVRPGAGYVALEFVPAVFYYETWS